MDVKKANYKTCPGAPAELPKTAPGLRASHSEEDHEESGGASCSLRGDQGTRIYPSCPKQTIPTSLPCSTPIHLSAHPKSKTLKRYLVPILIIYRTVNKNEYIYIFSYIGIEWLLHSLILSEGGGGTDI